MKKACKFLMLSFLIISVLGGISRAGNLEALTDKFYAGLAAIIENNMDNPSKCVNEVNAYYEDNQALIGQIKKETEEAFKKMEGMSPVIAASMDKYMNMSEEELEALEKSSARQAQREPQMSAALDRYSKAIEAFTAKYLSQGLEISMKAMQLMPACDSYNTGY